VECGRKESISGVSEWSEWSEGGELMGCLAEERIGIVGRIGIIGIIVIGIGIGLPSFRSHCRPHR